MGDTDGGKQQVKPDRQVYVPPGRRKLLEKMEQDERERKERGDPEPPVSISRKSASSSSSSSTPSTSFAAAASATTVCPWNVERTRPIVSDSEFATVLDDDRLVASCLIAHGFPSEWTDAERMRNTNAYVKHGGRVHWLGPQSCLIVFRNEGVASRALQANITARYKPERLSSSPFITKSIVEAVRGIHAELKPDRDTRVANRLIGAALGIRLPSKPVSGKPSSPEVVFIDDAWDDP